MFFTNHKIDCIIYFIIFVSILRVLFYEVLQFHSVYVKLLLKAYLVQMISYCAFEINKDVPFVLVLRGVLLILGVGP